MRNGCNKVYLYRERTAIFFLLLLDERFQISSLLLTICFKNAPASATDFFLFFLSIKLMLAVSLLNGVTSNIRVTE